MRIKTIIINFIFFAILFLTADILFSNFIYKHNIGQKCYEIDEDGKFYKLQKNCRSKMRRLSSIDSFKVYTDNKGNRYSGLEYNTTEENVFFFGDSHTFGLGWNWEHTFVGIIESEKKKYKITNLAVPSYSPTVFYYLLQKLNKEKILNSNKVFVVIDITDVADESIRWRSNAKKTKPFLSSSIANKKSGFKKFKRQHLKGSHIIATFLRESGRNLRKKFRLKNTNRQIEKYSEEKGTWPGRFTFTKFSDLEGCNKANNENNPWDCGGVRLGIKKIEQKMKDFGDIIKLSNSELYIVIFPWPETLVFGQKIFNWENYINKICKISECTKVINLFPDFINIKEAREDWLSYLYLPNDFHLSKNGNSIVADKILKEAF